MNTQMILKELFAAYSNTQVSAATATVYVKLLADIPTDDLEIIVNQCIAELKFLPTIAEIRDRWHEITRNPDQITAAEAWGEVQREIRRIGSWGRPTFDDERIERVVQMMGWLDICQSDKPGVDRAQFMRMYDAVMEREQSTAKMLPAARQLAERKGMKPIGDSVKHLFDNGSDE